MKAKICVLSREIPLLYRSTFAISLLFLCYFIANSLQLKRTNSEGTAKEQRNQSEVRALRMTKMNNAKIYK